MEDAAMDGVTAWTQTCVPKAADLPDNNEAAALPGNNEAAALPGNNEAAALPDNNKVEREFRPSLLQHTTRSKLVVGYRHFGTTCRSHLKGSNFDLGGRDRVVVPKRL